MKLNPAIIAVSLTFCAVSALPSEGKAAFLNDSLEIQATAAIGGPPGLAGADIKGGATTAPFTLYLAGRLRLPKWTPLELELNIVIPHGIGVNLLIDVVRVDRVRIHIGDPGIFWNIGSPVSVSRVERGYDITLGAGVDVAILKGWSVNLDWRMFLPNPFRTIPVYADFARPVYSEAARGGQLWLGASYVF